MRRVGLILSVLVGCAGGAGDDELEDAGTAAAESDSTGAGSSDGGTTGGRDTGAVDESSGSSDGGSSPIDCTDACSDLASDAGIAVCYSCRCKNAMDGYLPSVDELQCSQAEELTLYTADLSSGSAELVPLTGDSPDQCVNPALLYETCGVGSRLGQMTVGDVHVKWVCRDPYGDGTEFADVGVIMHNTRNGASCWFDDVDYVTTTDNLPDLDLMESDQDNLDAYLERFYFTDGDSCTRDCHGSDPFVYTPYFQGIQWETGSWVVGRHGRVTLDGTLAPVDAYHLVNPEVLPCASCHRVGSTASCDFLGPDAVGTYKTAAHEQAVIDAQDPMSDDWWLAFWMPSPLDAEKVPTRAAWEDQYGVAQQLIEQCCQAPGVATPQCMWEPIPPPN